MLIALWLSLLERRLWVWVVMNVPSSSPDLTLNFVSVAYSIYLLLYRFTPLFCLLVRRTGDWSMGTYRKG